MANERKDRMQALRTFARKPFMLLSVNNSGEITRTDHATKAHLYETFARIITCPRIMYAEAFDIRGDDDVTLKTFDRSNANG